MIALAVPRQRRAVEHPHRVGVPGTVHVGLPPEVRPGVHRGPQGRAASWVVAALLAVVAWVVGAAVQQSLVGTVGDLGSQVPGLVLAALIAAGGRR